MTHELCRKKSDTEGDKLESKILNKIRNSDILAANAEGDRVLRGTFPVLAALLDSSRPKDAKNEKEEGGGGASSMNAVKESVLELLSIISGALKRPLILFLDDLQWADAPSLDLLSFLLSTDAQIKNIMFICAYRSNEMGEGHPFASLMEKVKESSKGDEQLVETVDLFSLSQEVITQFIADSICKGEGVEEVTELADVVYQKTMGNIFCVMQAMEELVRKNALYYDIMCFEWRWAVSKVELSTTISDDVVETVKGKIKVLSEEMQHMLIVMAYVPNTLEVPVLTKLTKRNLVSLDESRVAELLKEASEEAMLMHSAESGNYMFAHDRIREASRG
jgi:predicted ATPase